MATTAPQVAGEIRIFAMFPRDSQSSELEWHWLHLLSFPLDKLNSLDIKPRTYKWIRYATGVVVGAQGDLSSSANPEGSVVDYSLGFPSESCNVYYHIDPAERNRMFPADPDLARSKVTSEPSEPSSRRRGFHNDVADRDGFACVLTGYHGRVCEAAHLLPHSKGNEYIRTYTERRSREPDGRDIIGEIDDVRNGIYLNKITHGAFGTDVAFLMTPNFAMNTSDVEPSASPEEKRCTAHLFAPDLPEYFGNVALPSGSQVRMPNAAEQVNHWPLDILFDAIYANAILYHFAPQTTKEILRQKYHFYPGGVRSREQADQQKIAEQAAQTEQTKTGHDHQREERHARRTSHAGDDHGDYFDALLVMPYINIPREQLEVVWRERREKKAEMDKSHLEDKVIGWAKGIVEACP